MMHITIYLSLSPPLSLLSPILSYLHLDHYAEQITTLPADRMADEEAHEECTFRISKYTSYHGPQVDYLWFIRG